MRREHKQKIVTNWSELKERRKAGLLNSKDDYKTRIVLRAVELHAGRNDIITFERDGVRKTVKVKEDCEFRLRKTQVLMPCGATALFDFLKEDNLWMNIISDWAIDDMKPATI